MNRPPAIAFILLTILLDVIGFGLIIPVMPALIGQFTSDARAQSDWYGAIVATFGVAQFLNAPLLGALSDRYGRRPVLLLGIAGLGVTFAITALADSLWLIVLSRLIGGGLSANFAVAQAYVADITPPERRTQALGKIGAAFGIGFVVGPMLGGLLGGIDLRLPLFAAAGLCCVNWLYGLLVLPESLAPGPRKPITLARINPFLSLGGLARLRGVGSLALAVAATTFAQFMLQAIWVLYTGLRFGWGPRESGTSLFAVGVVSIIVQGGLLRPLIARLGEQRLVLAGLFSGILAFAAYGLVTQGWMLYVVIAANFLAFASGTVLQGIVSKAADASEQGRVMASLGSLASLVGLFAMPAGALLLGRVALLPPSDWRLGTPFFLAAVLQAVSFFIARRHFARAPAAMPATAAAT